MRSGEPGNGVLLFKARAVIPIQRKGYWGAINVREGETWKIGI